MRLVGLKKIGKEYGKLMNTEIKAILEAEDKIKVKTKTAKMNEHVKKRK